MAPPSRLSRGSLLTWMDRCSKLFARLGVKDDTKPFVIVMSNDESIVFTQARDYWKLDDFYRCPGPIQFEGPVADIANYTVSLPTKVDTPKWRRSKNFVILV